MNRIELTVRVDGPDPAWLYYADGWHPGWSARVDGLPATVRVADRAFKAVALGPGPHEVELRFFAWPGSAALLVLLVGSLVAVPWVLAAGLVGESAPAP